MTRTKSITIAAGAVAALLGYSLLRPLNLAAPAPTSTVRVVYGAASSHWHEHARARTALKIERSCRAVAAGQQNLNKQT